MKKPSDSEIQAFQIGLEYAMQTLCREVDQRKGTDWTAKDVGKMVVADLTVVRHSQIMAKDALTTRLPVNVRKTDLGSLANPENAYPPGGKCETCGGSGRLDLPFDTTGTDCHRCGGSGIQPARKESDD